MPRIAGLPLACLSHLALACLSHLVSRDISDATDRWLACPTSFSHNNAACRGERTKAREMYESLSHELREKVPQTLRVWLRYRSEKYFGEHRTPPQK